MKKLTFLRIAAALLVGAASVTAFAAQRTFVASYGLDTNPCTVTSPCRSFAAAMTPTDVNGEIIVLDSAGYGPVTITKSVSIIAPPGVYAGVSVFTGQDGVTVSAGAGDKVVLRGLTINGQGGQMGINFSTGYELHIENCVVSNMGSIGIVAAGGQRVFIKDTVVRSSGVTGIAIAFPTLEVHVDRARSEGNGQWGMQVLGGPRVWVSNSNFVDNAGGGVLVQSTGPLTQVVVESSNLSGNGGLGISASTGGAGGVVEVSAIRSTLSGNGAGAAAVAGPGGTVILTVTDNLVTGNTFGGLVAANAGAVLVASGNTVTRSGTVGLAQVSPAVFLSRGNNTVSQNVGGNSSGTITPLPGL